jgi:hypothetical protein
MQICVCKLTFCADHFHSFSQVTDMESKRTNKRHHNHGRVLKSAVFCNVISRILVEEPATLIVVTDLRVSHLTLPYSCRLRLNFTPI